MSVSSKTVNRLMAVAQVAGLIASGWFVWSHILLPRLSRQTLADLAGEALFYVAMAWACGAIVTFCVYFVVSLADLPDVMRFSFRSSAPAMWFAPAIVMLSAPLPAAFVVSLIFITSATRLLISQWAGTQSPLSQPAPERARDTFLFHTLAAEAPYFSPGWAAVLMGSITGQAGLVAKLWNNPLLAAAFLAASTAILTSLAMVTGAYRPAKAPALPPSMLSVAVTFLLAASLSFGGLAVRRGGHAATDVAFDPAAPPAGTTAIPASADSSEMGGDFPGVILLPERKSHVTLVAPASSSVLGPAITKPVGILFSGEYWMFRPPRRQPPQQSVVRRGKPSELSFHTTDGAPMEMEAHQSMDPPVDVRCCSTIQLAIMNTDTYPGTVSLELILIDSEPAGRRSESLGTALAASSNSFAQILTFPMPPAKLLPKFDEIKVIFHRDKLRADKSARIAIEQFLLVP